jgi:uroporphyrinogen decarboxylase
MPINSRERVLTALNHEEPDRVPIVVGVSNATSMKMLTYQRLKAHLGIQAEDCYLYDWRELGTAAVDEQTLQRLHSDVRSVLDRFPPDVYWRNQGRAPHTPFIDDWGIGQEEIEPGVWFPNIHPLTDADSLDVIEDYPWPDMHDRGRVAHAREEVRDLAEDGQYSIMGVPWLLFPLERAFALQGMDQFMINLAVNRDFAQALLKKVAELCKTLMGNFLHETGEYLDIIKIGDDLGMQDRLLISPQMYRQVLKPIHAEYIAFIKDHTKAKVLFHSDGDIYDLVDDLVEIGVDILNPIQTSVGRIANLKELKTRYGDKLCFCGGIDTHHILPFGSQKQVRQEVSRVIEALAPGGGFLLAAVHTIMEEVPPVNILAMVDAVEQYHNYPFR